jgi:glycosyltransferase involved in cell wall biosynthesis
VSEPAVSIVLPTYNRAAFLPAAVGSVLAQSFADWEFLVVDDGSTDGTLARFAEFSRGDPRIRLVQNPGTRGPAGARNAGLGKCRAPWVAFLDSDDAWEPQKLERFMAAAEANPEAVLIGSDYWLVDREAGTRQTMLDFLATTMLPWWRTEAAIAAIVPCQAIAETPTVLAERDVMVSTVIAEYLWVHTSSAMVRRDAVRKLGGFKENLARTEDVELWLDLAESGFVLFIPEALATFDVTGRDAALGARYAAHELKRKPTLYSTRLLHLDLMKRIGRRPLTPAQRAVLADRIAHGHRACSAAGRGIIPLRRRLVHALAGSQVGPLCWIGATLWSLRDAVPGAELQDPRLRRR